MPGRVMSRIRQLGPSQRPLFKNCSAVSKLSDCRLADFSRPWIDARIRGSSSTTNTMDDSVAMLQPHCKWLRSAGMVRSTHSASQSGSPHYRQPGAFSRGSNQGAGCGWNCRGSCHYTQNQAAVGSFPSDPVNVHSQTQEQNWNEHDHGDRDSKSN